MKIIISCSPTLSSPWLRSACFSSPKVTINAVCRLQNNQLETSGWCHIRLHPLLFTVSGFTKKPAMCSSFSRSNRPLNCSKLKAQSCSWLWRKGERGHGNRLINKVLYDFTISVRGHRRWMSHQGHNSGRCTQTHKHADTQNLMERWSLAARCALLRFTDM